MAKTHENEINSNRYMFIAGAARRRRRRAPPSGVGRLWQQQRGARLFGLRKSGAADRRSALSAARKLRKIKAQIVNK